MFRYKEAIACYDKVIALNPNIPVTYFNKGFSLQNMAYFEKSSAKYEEAIACYDKAICLVPAYAKAFNRKATCLFELHKHNEAIQCYSQAIQLNPLNKTFQNDRQKALEKLKTLVV